MLPRVWSSLWKVKREEDGMPVLEGERERLVGLFWLLDS